jgi:hypothetical protein
MADGTIRITGIDGAGGLEALVTEFHREAEIAPDEARKVVQKGLLNIKNDWRRRWTGHPHAPRLPYAITYDSVAVGPRIMGEVGPDKDKPQGALGNLFEYGSVNNPPIPGGAPALEAERPKFERAMEALPFPGEKSWR